MFLEKLKRYIYCSQEEGFIANDFFYNINGLILERHKLNDIFIKNEDETDFSYDTSVDRQKAVVRVINEDIKEMIKLCKEYNRDMPTEMKLIYDVKSGSFKAEYQYDLVYTHDDVKTANHIADEWFKEVKRKRL